MLNMCFTGHRPDKLYGYDLNDKKYKFLELKLYSEIIKQTIKSEYKPPYKFIFGGALGLDQIAFDCCMELKKRFNNIEIITEIAIPFKNQPDKWNDESKKYYFEQLSKADIITYVDELEGYKVKGKKTEEYYPYKMQIRNQYMVDNSDLVIAVWDGSIGGTKNCVKYAMKNNKKIIQINPKKII